MSLPGDRYRALQHLHSSQSGRVYVAEDLSTPNNDVVVVKLKSTSELGATHPLSHEATLLGSLPPHPNVVRLLRSESLGNNTHAIVLERAPHGDLAALLAARGRAPLPEPRIWAALAQLAAGLGHLHVHRVIHRDLKPSNVLLFCAELGAAPGAVKLGDLGVARRLSEQSDFATTCQGTPTYLSPELCRGEPYTEKTDMWSLGVVLYELAALRPPFEARGVMELAAAICRGTYAPLAGAYSHALRETVRALLSADPNRRPGAEELLQFVREKCALAEAAELFLAPPSPAGAAKSVPAPAFNGSPGGAVVQNRHRPAPTVPVAAPVAALAAPVPEDAFAVPPVSQRDSRRQLRETQRLSRRSEAFAATTADSPTAAVSDKERARVPWASAAPARPRMQASAALAAPQGPAARRTQRRTELQRPERDGGVASRMHELGLPAQQQALERLRRLELELAAPG